MVKSRHFFDQFLKIGKIGKKYKNIKTIEILELVWCVFYVVMLDVDHLGSTHCRPFREI